VITGGGIGGTPTAFIARCLITHNTSGGLSPVGGSITSYGGNVISGNGGNQNPSATLPQT
jgi:hypothetical protein